MRIKNTLLAALGLVTLAKLAVMPALGAPVLLVLVIRNSVAVAVFTAHDPPDPRFDEDAKVEVVELKPVEGEQAPLAVVQAAKPTDFMVVACADVNVKL